MYAAFFVAEHVPRGGNMQQRRRVGRPAKPKTFAFIQLLVCYFSLELGKYHVADRFG